jgi:argininosuccinate synthase
MTKKVVLAYSGGLDTSAIVPWLIENHECEVIAVVGDVGQGEAELSGVEEKAERSGASACYVIDLRREFIEEFVYPTLITGAVYEGRYLLGTSMARPILARAQVQIALETGAHALAHGCTGISR